MAADRSVPKLNLLATAIGLRSELRGIRAALERQAERLDQIECDLSIVIDAARAVGEPADVSLFGHMPLAHSLSCRRNPDDSAEFQLDAGGYFSLSPRLSQVLLFLASAPKGPDDSLVAWRSRDELVELLQEQTGRRVPRRYVNNVVHLLKNAFQKVGLDRRLIQTHRRKGVRLALKYSATPVIGSGLR